MAGVTRLPTPLALDKPTLAKQFQAAGYGTAVFGKMHLNRAAAPGLFGFDVMMTENEIRAAWMRDVKPQAIPAGRAHETALEAVSGSGAHLAERGETAVSQNRSGDAGHLHRGQRGAVSGTECREAICDVGEFHGAALAVRFPGGIQRPLRPARASGCRVSVPKTAGRSRSSSAISAMRRSGASTPPTTLR